MFKKSVYSMHTRYYSTRNHITLLEYSAMVNAKSERPQVGKG